MGPKPKWDQNKTKRDLKQNGAKMGLKWDQNWTKWDKNGTKMD